ncbi:MAG: glycosyltransferase family 39 protein [Prolixibacteraceae bacterium]|nr:glycosyltransferase family 39 protein [Prolixibacteraceae bacterium]
MLKGLIQSNKKNFQFLIGLLLFTGLNIFSAFTMELHFDEAYYWLYSQYPALGYFDHPPMVSWLISAGSLFFENELGVRLLTILLSTTAMFFLWKMVKVYSANALLFWCLVYSIILFQPYCFISTPDAPLLAFSILFFYFFRRYLAKNSFQNIFLLAFTLALALYSKYHAVLIVLFVLIANYKLFKKPTFWIVTLITLIYFLPHIIWQIDHQFPSVRYHLIDSHKTIYKPGVTLNYFLSLILLTGPWLGWLFLIIMFWEKPENNWERALKYTGVGIISFFFLATFAGDFEAHWILLAMIPLFVLSYKVVVNKQKWQRWVVISGIVNFILLLTVRILILTPVVERIAPLKLFAGNKAEMLKIKKFAGDTPVVFQDNWIGAAKYAWYTRDKKTACLNSALYRRNQFDLIDADEELSGKGVYVLTSDSNQFQNIEVIETAREKYFAKYIDDFRSFYNIELKHPDFKRKGNKIVYTVEIFNPYADTLRLGKKYHVNSEFQLYTKDKAGWNLVGVSEVNKLVIQPKKSVQYQGYFLEMNDFEPSNNLFFSLKIGELKPVPGRFSVKLQDAK